MRIRFKQITSIAMLSTMMVAGLGSVYAAIDCDDEGLPEDPATEACTELQSPNHLCTDLGTEFCGDAGPGKTYTAWEVEEFPKEPATYPQKTGWQVNSVSATCSRRVLCRIESGQCIVDMGSYYGQPSNRLKLKEAQCEQD